MERISDIWRGEISLPKMFWLYGVGGLVVAGSLFGAVFVVEIVLALFFAFQGDSHTDVSSIVANAWLLLGLFLVALMVLIPIGIWRSAGKFEGSSVWRLLAQAGSCLVLLAFGAADFAAFSMADTIYSVPSRKAEIAARTAAHRASLQSLGPPHQTAQAPWNGLWKYSCADNSGFVIEALPQSSPRYQLTWCEPTGCSRTGDTLLVGDSDYRFVDKDTIDKWDKDGGRWLRLVRCN